MLFSYKNGDFTVSLYEDGTKVREGSGVPLYPESIDLKITNYCDLHNYCKWCHEQSDTTGKHADLKATLGLLRDLPPGVELAVGGGNPLSHPNLLWFLRELNTLGLVPNLTVNMLHVKPYLALLRQLTDEGLVYGLGVSYSPKRSIDIVKSIGHPHVVYHVIAGLTPIDELGKLVGERVLVLGYKTYGKGKSYFSKTIEDGLYNWRVFLPKYFGKCLLSFDNLGIEQLSPQRFLSKEYWDNHYMGDDGTFTMYIDAITGMYAPTSTSDNRESFAGKTIATIFKNVRTNN